MGSAMYAPTATSSGDAAGGNGATHTVIVAPSQGVLRYVPFALNASVGDTIFFMWGANNHTVTKSSALTPCNKTSDALFASGTHDKDFTCTFTFRFTSAQHIHLFAVTQVVNSTDPTFFYCATPGHCAKGMFGIMYAFISFFLRANGGLMFSQQPSQHSARFYLSRCYDAICRCQRTFLSWFSLGCDSSD